MSLKITKLVLKIVYRVVLFVLPILVYTFLTALVAGSVNELIASLHNNAFPRFISLAPFFTFVGFLPFLFLFVVSQNFKNKFLIMTFTYSSVLLMLALIIGLRGNLGEESIYFGVIYIPVLTAVSVYSLGFLLEKKLFQKPKSGRLTIKCQQAINGS